MKHIPWGESHKGISECMKESLAGGEEKANLHMYQLHVPMSGSLPSCCLLESSSAQWGHCTRRLTMIHTVGGCNNKRLTNVGTTKVVPTSDSLSSLLPLGIIFCSMLSLHLYPG